MGEEEDSVSAYLRHLGRRRKSRIVADSQMGFTRYALKMLLVSAFIVVDGLLIPSAFQAAGLLTRADAIPIAIALLAAVFLQAEALSRFR